MYHFPEGTTDTGTCTAENGDYIDVEVDPKFTDVYVKSKKVKIV